MRIGKYRKVKCAVRIYIYEKEKQQHRRYTHTHNEQQKKNSANKVERVYRTKQNERTEKNMIKCVYKNDIVYATNKRYIANENRSAKNMRKIHRNSNNNNNTNNNNTNNNIIVYSMKKNIEGSQRKGRDISFSSSYRKSIHTSISEPQRYWA